MGTPGRSLDLVEILVRLNLAIDTFFSTKSVEYIVKIAPENRNFENPWRPNGGTLGPLLWGVFAPGPGLIEWHQKIIFLKSVIAK